MQQGHAHLNTDEKITYVAGKIIAAKIKTYFGSNNLKQTLQ